MTIGSVSSSLAYQAMQPVQASEGAERGPENDHDGDDPPRGTGPATSSPLGSAPPHRANLIDMLA